MFQALGVFVQRAWLLILIVWLAVFLAAMAILQGWCNQPRQLFSFKVPTWKGVAEDGEFAHLPRDMQSLVGERRLADAFPHDLLKSSVVIVVRRDANELTPDDESFIDQTLLPRLQSVVNETAPGRAAEKPLSASMPTGDAAATEAKGGTSRAGGEGDDSGDTSTTAAAPDARRVAPVSDESTDASDAGEASDIASRIKTFRDPLMGRLLVSDDKKASLVIVPLPTEFLEWGNQPLIEGIEKLTHALRDEKLVPEGIELAISGSATVGLDMLVAADDSAKATELWTTILVIALLVMIYRAPLLALIPLITVYISVQIALALQTLLTQVPWLGYKIFMGMEVYITVVVYGSGVDYCLFLIARYKEVLDHGTPIKKASGEALARIGAALTASAATVICGIGMMYFAQFGKFREAGLGISLSLCVVLLASLTFTPALLRLVGMGAFWPFVPANSSAGSASSPRAGHSGASRMVERDSFDAAWEAVGRWVMSVPARILIGFSLLMLPFAIVGVMNHDFLSYGLLSELPSAKKSVIGAKAVQEHFPAGYAGPLTVLLEDDTADFNEVDMGMERMLPVLKSLEAKRAELKISDIRSVWQPLGQEFASPFDETATTERLNSLKGLAKSIYKSKLEQEKKQAREYYVSATEPFSGKTTRVDLIFDEDPFTRESIGRLNAVEAVIRDTLASEKNASTTVRFVGPTASIRDLKTVTDGDQIRIDILVLASVYLVLVILLRKPALSLYLIFTVFFSYFATLGMTFVVYWAADPAGFGGLDWKVPIFLFTILIAVGEDYNIFLITRIEEEQELHGEIEGLRIAMLRTGSIISSCGIVMAGTFLSLMAGTLVGLKQLGFALAFGVMLDTFVVRPLLVPAYLMLLYRGAFGFLTPLLSDAYFAAWTASRPKLHGDDSAHARSPRAIGDGTTPLAATVASSTTVPATAPSASPQTTDSAAVLNPSALPNAKPSRGKSLLRGSRRERKEQRQRKGRRA